MPSSPDKSRNMPAVPAAQQNKATSSITRVDAPVSNSSSSHVSPDVTGADTSSQALDKGEASPPSPTFASLVAALAGQKRSATEVEEERSQEGTNKRSKVAEG